MANSHTIRDWRIIDVFRKFPGLCAVPAPAGGVRLDGDLEFDAVFNGVRIQDCYAVEIEFPARFSTVLPSVKETGGRIPRSFHHLDAERLCLGSPFRIFLDLQANSTALAFVERWVVPYLYGYSHLEQYGALPFGELKHGFEGLIADLQSEFRTDNEKSCLEMVRLAGLRRRMANRQTCPCGSGKRAGRCHNRRINDFRRRMGRTSSRDIHKVLSRGRRMEKSFQIPQSRRTK